MSSENFPEEGRLLGIDFGTVRVGLAITTREQNIASPLEIYQRKNETLDAKYFQEIVKENRVVGLVVGLPLHVNGDESVSATRAREYGKWLSELTGVPVLYWDERYTSAVAEEQMIGIDLTRKQRKRRLDMVAAQIFLQSYLDTKLKERQRAEAAAEQAAEDDHNVEDIS